MIHKSILTIIIYILLASIPTAMAISNTTSLCKIWNTQAEGTDTANWICTGLIGGLPADGVNTICVTGKFDNNTGKWTGVKEMKGSVEASRVKDCRAIITKTGIDGFNSFLAWIYKTLIGVALIIAVIIIIFSGIELMVAGLADTVNSAKNRIIYALSAIALLSLVGTILHFINPIFFTIL